MNKHYGSTDDVEASNSVPTEIPGNFHSFYAASEKQRSHAKRTFDLKPSDVVLITIIITPSGLALIGYIGPNGEWTELALNSSSATFIIWRSIDANLSASLGMNFFINVYYGVEVLQHGVEAIKHVISGINIREYLKALRSVDENLYSRIISKISATRKIPLSIILGSAAFSVLSALPSIGKLSLVVLLAGLSALPPVYLTQSTSSNLSKTIPEFLRIAVNGMPMWSKDLTSGLCNGLLNATAARRLLEEPDPFFIALFRLLGYLLRPVFYIPLSGVRFANNAIRQIIFAKTYQEKKTVRALRRGIEANLLGMRAAVCDVLEDANNKIHTMMARGNRDGKLNGIYELMRESNLTPTQMLDLLTSIMQNGKIPLPLTDREQFVKLICALFMLGNETASLLGFAALCWPQAQQIRQTVLQWFSMYLLYYMSSSFSTTLNNANDSSAWWSPADFPVFLVTFFMFFYLCSAATLYLGRVVFNALNESHESFWKSDSSLGFIKDIGLNFLNRSWGEPLLTPSLPLMQSRFFLLPLLAGLYIFAIWSSGPSLFVNKDNLSERLATYIYYPTIFGTTIMNWSPFPDILGAASQTFIKVTEKFINICGVRIPYLSKYLAGLKDEIDLISYNKKMQKVFKEMPPEKLLSIFKELIDEARAGSRDFTLDTVEKFIRASLGIPIDLESTTKSETTIEVDTSDTVFDVDSESARVVMEAEATESEASTEDETVKHFQAKNKLYHYLKKIWPNITMAEINNDLSHACINYIETLVAAVEEVNTSIKNLNEKVNVMRRIGVFADLNVPRVNISEQPQQSSSLMGLCCRK